MVRRGQFDPLDNPRNEPRWLVVTSMNRAILEVRPLAPTTDLRRTLIEAMLEWMDAGFQIPEFTSRLGLFFASKGMTRHMIEITPTDHGKRRGRALDG